MIQVARSAVPAPVVLRKKDEQEWRRESHSYFVKHARRSRLQTRFEYRWLLTEDAEKTLDALFHGKCAYCESAPGTTPFGVDHFRPRSELRRADGEPLADGYWWLAYDWDNLVLACPDCRSAKRNAFPVDGPRAKPGTTGRELRRERALLLDPTADLPELLLTFTRDGTVKPRPVLKGEDWARRRAAATIEILHLNRPFLVEQRAMTATLVTSTLASFLGVAASGSHERTRVLLDTIRRLFAPEQPYLAVRRQLFEEWWFDSTKALGAPLAAAVADAAGQREPRLAAAAPAEPSAKSRAVRRPSSRARKAAAMPASHAWYIRRIEIKNYKAVADLAVDMHSGRQGPHGSWQEGWKVLLGENGTGKSSVLQAVALAMMGPAHFKKQGIRPKTLLRRLPNGRLVKKAEVRIFWRDRAEPWVMRLDAKRVEFSGEKPLATLVVRAYGATRRLPVRSGPVPSHAPLQRVDNLLDPFQPVCDAIAWLLSLRGAAAFGSAALSIKDLFNISLRSLISRRRGRVMVRLNGVDVSLDELSDGFQSVLVLAVDIMTAVRAQAHDLHHTTGVVLLDEIDAHLHPRWKMQIVGALRRTFPGLQFLSTTHEPLCLRGLGEHEIVVMKREGRSLHVLTQLPSAEGLRVDQLLTSPFFSLHSTIDPDLERKFERYYKLLAKEERALGSSEQEELRQLRTELAGVGILGNSRRDQMVYEIIDQYLAREPKLADRAPVKEATKRRVLEAWNNVTALAQRAQ